MDNLNIGEKDFKINVINGTVIQSEKRTFAEVSGGGGSIKTNIVTGRTSGKIKQVQSVEKTVTEIWLELSDGSQAAFNFKQDIMAIKGNELALITLEDSKTNNVVAVINKTTNVRTDVVDTNSNLFSDIPKFKDLGRKLFLITPIAVYLLFFLLNISDIGSNSIVGREITVSTVLVRCFFYAIIPVFIAWFCSFAYVGKMHEKEIRNAVAEIDIH